MWGDVSAVDGRVAYFLPGNFRSKIVFAYNSTTNKWSELPKCPNSYVSLAMVNSLFTAIGGRIRNNEVTNSLLSLTGNEWTKQFPPMPTKRWFMTAVCSGRSLVVAGGVREGRTWVLLKWWTQRPYSGPQQAAFLTHSLKHQQHSAETRLIAGRFWLEWHTIKVSIHLLTGCPSPVLPATVLGRATEDFVISS